MKLPSPWLRKCVPWEEKENGAKHKFPLELTEGIRDTSLGLDAKGTVTM